MADTIIPFTSVNTETATFGDLEANMMSEGQHMDIHFEGVSKWDVFEAPAMRIRFAIKPGKKEIRQPSKTEEYLKTPFNVVCDIEVDNPDHAAFKAKCDVLDEKLAAIALKAPKDFVPSKELAVVPEENRPKFVLSKHKRLVKANQLKDEDDEDEGVWGPSTSFKIYGIAGLAKKFVWEKAKKDSDDPKKVKPDYLKAIERAEREVGVPSEYAPAKDAPTFLYVWNTIKGADGSEEYEVVDQLPMCDTNGQSLKDKNGKIRMRYVGPQDTTKFGTVIKPLFQLNKAWAVMSTGYGITKIVKNAVYIFPPKPRVKATLASAKLSRPSEDVMLAILAANRAEEQAAHDEEAKRTRETADGDEYADAVAPHEGGGADDYADDDAAFAASEKFEATQKEKRTKSDKKDKKQRTA